MSLWLGPVKKGNGRVVWGLPSGQIEQGTKIELGLLMHLGFRILSFLVKGLNIPKWRNSKLKTELLIRSYRFGTLCKRRSDILREHEKTLRKSETSLTEKESDIKLREKNVSDKLKDIEKRQGIIERKENMIREMAQLVTTQEMVSTRDLNFHTRRMNRYHDEGARRHARLDSRV